MKQQSVKLLSSLLLLQLVSPLNLYLPLHRGDNKWPLTNNSNQFTSHTCVWTGEAGEPSTRHMPTTESEWMMSAWVDVTTTEINFFTILMAKVRLFFPLRARQLTAVEWAESAPTVGCTRKATPLSTVAAVVSSGSRGH